MPPLALPALLRRYWLLNLIVPVVWLILFVLGSLTVGPGARSLPENLALLASAGALAFVAFLALAVLGALLGRLRPASIDIGVGRVVVKRYTPWGIVRVRWLPIWVQAGWLLDRSVRLARHRLALPYALPLVGFIAAYVAVSSGPAVVLWTGTWTETIQYAAKIGTVVTLAALVWFLNRTSSLDPAEQYGPYVDRRVRTAQWRLNAALYDGGRALIRQRHEALLSIDPPALVRSESDAAVAYAVGEFASAAHQLERLRARDGSLRYPSALLLAVLAATEAGHPVDPYVVEIARETSRQLFARGASVDTLLSAVACSALLDGDVDTAIEWGEAAVRYRADPRSRIEDMLMLARCYAARGRATDAEKALARSRRIERDHPRLPHVARIVADHLSREAVALSHDARDAP